MKEILQCGIAFTGSFIERRDITMNKIKTISVLIVFLVFFLLVKLPGEYAVITAGKVEGIICSDKYINKVRHFGSKNRFYVYKVRYTVDGQIYESEQFETGVV